MAKSVEDLLSDVEELAASYQRYADTEIPRSVQEARKEGWELIPSGAAIAGITPYIFSERKQDGQRVIRLTTALELIEGYEDGLLSKTVRTPKGVFVKNVRTLVRIVRFTLDSFPQLWDEAKQHVDLWDILDLLAWIARLGFIFDLLDSASRLRAFIETTFELIRRWGLLVLSTLLAAFGLDVFNKTAIAVQQERELWIQRMRKAALPQIGPRKWRRKVSRL